MAVNLSPFGGVGVQFFDNSGNPLTGGKIFTYTAGTTTPQTTYTTSAGTIPHTNPIILDAGGRVPSGGEIWLTDGLQYKFLLKDANDVQIASYDNVIGINSNFVNYTNEQEIQTATAGQTVFNLATMQYQPGTNSLSVFVDGVNQYGPGAQYAYVETDSDTVTFVSGLHVGASVKFTTSQLNTSGAIDASQVSYNPPFTGGVATNVEAKLSEYVSVKDFGAVGDGATDDTAAIQAALDTGLGVYIPSGTYRVTDQLTMSANGSLFGNGPSSVILSAWTTPPSIDSGLILADTVNNLTFQNFSINGSSQAHALIEIDTCEDVTISDLNLYNIAGSAIYAYYIGNKKMLIHNVKIKNVSGGTFGAIRVAGEFIKVSNCSVINHSDKAFAAALAGGPIEFVACQADAGNLTTSNSTSFYVGFQGRNVIFNGCAGIVRSGSANGVKLSQESKDCVVTNCTFKAIYDNSDNIMVFVQGGSRHVISNNIVDASEITNPGTVRGIDIQGYPGSPNVDSFANIVSNNQIRMPSGNTGWGLGLTTTSGASGSLNKLIGNHVYDAYQGAYILQPNHFIENNLFYENIYEGIIIAGTSGNSFIRGNNIYGADPTRHGIYAQNSGAAGNILIEGNYVDLHLTGGSGIRVQNSKQVIVNNNNLWLQNGVGTGIFVTSSENSTMVGNVIKGGSTGFYTHNVSGLSKQFLNSASNTTTVVDEILSPGLTGTWNLQADNTALNDKTSFINTLSGKIKGLAVYNTTSNKIVIATGSTDVSVWNNTDGTLSNTPI